ncbi:hypothetical protein CGCSCA1_v013143 [Colletotrichum siamense]|nr:hypothetical protein CGCSCA1_v013143 [Colletotrichum siamense]
MEIDSTFQVDLNILHDPLVPAAQKRWMLDIIFDQIVPYRYHQEPRLFPELSFYGTLLNNRADFMEIWAFVIRFHEWIYDLAISNSQMADAALEEMSQIKTSVDIELSLDLAQSIDALVPEYPSPPRTTAEMSYPATPQELPKQKTRAQTATNEGSDDAFLVAELQKPASVTYEGIIRDLDHFKGVDEAYARHVKRPAGTSPEEDASWPQTLEKRSAYVRDMYNAITQTDDFFELRKAKERLAKVRAKVGNTDAQASRDSDNSDDRDVEDNGSRKRRKTGNAAKGSDERPKGMSKSDWDLLHEVQPVHRLNAVIHHKISSIELEILCWRLLLAAEDAQRGFTMKPLWSGHRTVSTWDHYETFSDRWSAMCRELLDCKILVHSLLRADWFNKFASAPAKERGAKLSNDLLNGRRDIQNEIGRNIIRQKTSDNEWTTSENFEIRRRDGELVHKGSQIGDKARRQLAKRQAV